MFTKVIITLLINVIYYCCAERIGNYSSLHNYQSCGISKNTLMDGTNCFQYHKDMTADGGYDRVKDSRRAMHSEAPWTVQVKAINYGFWHLTRSESKCGGTLIGEEWVLTAAHCLKATHYVISTSHKWEQGFQHKAIKAIKHELFDQNKPFTRFDIGLIKLERRLKVQNQKDFNQIVSICLPARNFSSGTYLASLAGHGLEQPYLQITTVKIYHNYQEQWGYQTLLGSKACKGDSGTGIWLYEMGRAVLVGIHQSISCGKGVCCQSGQAAYVPYFIDWILDTINKN